MVSTIGKQLQELEMLINSLKLFFLNHKTLIDVIFLAIYTIEQLTLIILILLIPGFAHIIAGIFAVVFISTVSLERIAMEKRYNLLNETLLIQEGESEIMRNEHRDLVEANNVLRKALDEQLKE